MATLIGDGVTVLNNWLFDYYSCVIQRRSTVSKSSYRLPIGIIIQCVYKKSYFRFLFKLSSCCVSSLPGSDATG